MANPLVCIFNPITTLIDEIPSQSVFTGASAAGQPVVLNLNGLIDPSLIGQGTSATAGELLVAGALINLYNNGGSLYMQNAYAGTVGTPPSGGSYPKPAVGFVSSNVSINNSALVLFSGVFVYADPNSEFTASNIGAEVYLRWQSPASANAGGITLTQPTGPGQLQQSVGTVVGFLAPNFVSVAFVVQPQPAFNNFANIVSGTNTTATMTVGTGASLTFTGTGVVNANQLTGRPVDPTAPTTGQALVWNGTMWSPSSAAVTAFNDITSGTNTTATMTVGTGASIVVSGTGVVEATELATTGAAVVVNTAAPPTVGQVLTATSATAANWQTVSAGSAAFNTITSGTNTTAAMIVGSGATLTVAGTGVVEATELSTTGAPVDVSGSAPPTVGQVLTATSATTATWQSTGGNSFSAITTGTNTTATMTVGSGASIVVTGTGVVEATELATTGAAVVVSSAAPPTTGQVLTATSATTAAWQATSSPFIDKAQRFGTTLVNSGTLSASITCTFTSPFADNNYTAEVSAELGESLSTAGVKVAGFTKQAAGAGLNVWIENNDSINHNVTVHVFARHD